MYKLEPGVASFQHLKRCQKSSEFFKTMQVGHTTGTLPHRLPIQDLQYGGHEEKWKTRHKRYTRICWQRVWNTSLVRALDYISPSHPLSTTYTIFIRSSHFTSCSLFPHLQNGNNFNLCLLLSLRIKLTVVWKPFGPKPETTADSLRYKWPWGFFGWGMVKGKDNWRDRWW